MASSENTTSHLSAKPTSVATDILLQTPLSRRGEGPGLLLIVPRDYQGRNTSDANKTLDPEPLQKWAEEGFAVAEARFGGVLEHCEQPIKALLELPQCTSKEKVGVIVYASLPKETWAHLCRWTQVAALVSFTDNPTFGRDWPLLLHGSKEVIPSRDSDTLHIYENVSSTNFILPGHEHYQAGPAGVAHTRTLGFLRNHLGGPHFDLEAIWDEHCLFEFGERNVEKTMGTMVEEPYVNHIPTMTGGIGRSALTAFYRDHFIFNNPEDTALELISRTVGIDRVIDEFIFCFTHDKVIDWLIPGIPPTGKSVRIPFTSVVNVRGDRLYHEHIAWDQASILRQLGLLPEYLPFPYPLPDGRVPAKGKRFEYRVPTSGVDTARKLVDENSVVSNEMLGFEIREVDDV
ncbi:NTF2-like protein [Cadophora sp. DSE1049]|nr:NTF2-like protein [Cadophora sp. DSE1049]